MNSPAQIEVPVAPRRRFAQTLAYAVTVFLSAFLLFQVEPLIAKMILPWFGGVASVWAVCLLFFQVALLLGYWYAHLLTSRVSARRQGWIHAALLAASLAVLPIIPSASWKIAEVAHPAARIVLILSLTVGLPYFLLATSSPLLQAWWARGANSERTYRFYALSNAGSMLALITYPVLFEPKLPTRTQAMGWSAAYGVFAATCAAIALTTSRVAPQTKISEPASPPDRFTRWLWLGLAACGSALLLAVTTYISQNVAAVPFLWILPLALYLLTFIVCFSGALRWIPRSLALRLFVVALGSMTYALEKQIIELPLVYLVSIFCGSLFFCCLMCHRELAALKPDPQYLTSYYLMISLGGAVGAVFVVLLAPYLFNSLGELPISIAATVIVVPLAIWHDRASFLHARFPFVARIVTAAFVVAIVLSLGVAEHRENAGLRVAVRNFYGLLRVRDRVADRIPVTPDGAPVGDLQYRELLNGTIEHGTQWNAAELRRFPATYYTPSTGVGVALNGLGAAGPLRVGAIGLGAGTVAAYGRKGDRYTFYEINPLDVEIARNEFSYLRQSEAQIDIVMGDARLSLERQPPQNFDVLIVDAFSGDSIPVHLLTREAFKLYFRHVKPNGILAVHISNQYLELEPVVQADASSVNKACMTIENAEDGQTGQFAATWVLVGDLQTLLYNSQFRGAGKLLVSSEQERAWTDDYSSIFPLLKKK